MAAVPQKTLNWLYSVLIKDHYDPKQTYQDPNRTYYDVANVLAQYPSLSPRTDVYTYETGFSALLLHLAGTLPVSFRGAVYKFPISLWIPNTYPREPPIVYVTPTQDMAVRIGQHVTLEGRVYHHYLAHWAEAWDKSSIADLLLILREVFSKEPPVKYKQQPAQQRSQQPEPVQSPPPLPPLPPELGSPVNRPPTTQSVPSPQPTAQTPPRPPPKPGQISAVEQQQMSAVGRYTSPSSLPPLPPKDQGLRRQSFQPHTGITSPVNRASQYLPERTGVLGATVGLYGLSQPQQHNIKQSVSTYQPGSVYSQGASGVPTSALPQNFPQQQQQQPPPQKYPTQYNLTHQSTYQQPNVAYQQVPLQSPPQASPHRFPQTAPIGQPAPKPKAETQDLLTSPFELELPSFTPTGPPPPIPPNPEKDALLHAVSKTLAETLHGNVSQSESAAQALLSQSQSLHAAIATLQGEISSLNALNSTLQSNTSILQQSLHRADGAIANAQNRISSSDSPASSSKAAPSGLPPIDEVLVAPTVVGKQLYDLVADESGIQQAIYALQAALVKGVIGVDTWSRHTRGLAREAFLKRALIRKIGKGMGLEES